MPADMHINSKCLAVYCDVANCNLQPGAQQLHATARKLAQASSYPFLARQDLDVLHRKLGGGVARVMARLDSGSG
jgi:hypothetical protein